MFNFQKFSDATKSDTPQFAAAAAMQNKQEQQIEMQKAAAKSANLRAAVGAAALYDEGMGDKTPIGDFAGEQWTNAKNELGMYDTAGDVTLGDAGITSPAEITSPDVDWNALSDGSLRSDLELASDNVGQNLAAEEQLMTVEDGLAQQYAQDAAADAAAQEAAEQAAMQATEQAAVEAGTESALAEAGSSGGGNPYLTAALMADNLLFEGKGQDTLLDPKAYEDGIGMLFGKDIFWS